MDKPVKKYLVIQTASIGDVILATPVLEHIHFYDPEGEIDILIKNGLEGLFHGHPFIHKVLLWDKVKHKYINLLLLLKKIRLTRYDYVFNLQRFASTGFLTAFSGAAVKSGFNKNPFSCLFTYRIRHEIIALNSHETKRNLKITEAVFGPCDVSVKLYPTDDDFRSVVSYTTGPFICIAPASLWFTKQFPLEKWAEFIKKISGSIKVILVGSAQDTDLCNSLIKQVPGSLTLNLAGKLSLLQTAALFRKSLMNYVNDSAPLHLASAMDAPVTAVFCSTVPAFGFGPLSHDSEIVETRLKLSCRPCGIHGFSSCPEKHFHCANSIDVVELINRIR